MSIQESEPTDTAVDTPVAEDTAPAAEPVAYEDKPYSEPEPAAEPSEPSDPYADYGGRDVVEQAHRMHQATQSEDGIIQLFIEAGQSLGLGLREIQTLFEGGTLEPDEGEAPEYDPDEPITRAEWDAERQREQDNQQQSQNYMIEATARQAVAATAAELGIDLNDPGSQIILQMGDRYLNDDLSPQSIKDSMRRGQADYQALVERESQAYLAKKSAAGKTVPGAPSGSAAPSESAGAEPRDTAEAIKIARRKLGMSRA